MNDVWVSHPTWASEESGFVSHKKNSYEEALHKSEEERHEFQFYIDIITRTIALMEPLNARIMDMSHDERNAFRLPPDFGGSSKSIYHRAIKKVYGRDSQGLEILSALQECPSIAIPVVLERLKQKNEEWRRAQRDWNKVWREVDGRNFYKSLDHQGITFKANDKKFITNKSLVSEIEAAKAEIVKGAALAKKARGLKRDVEARLDAYDLELSPHLEFEFKDLGVLQDALKLTFSFLDRSSMQYSSLERRSVERMLRSFIPLICDLPLAEFDAAFGQPIEVDMTDNEEGNGNGMHEEAGMSDEGEDGKSGVGSGNRSAGTAGGSGSGRRSAGGGSHAGMGGIHPNDLRKKLLKTAQEKAAKAREGSVSASRAVSPTPSEDEHATGSGNGNGREHTPSLMSAMMRKKEKREREVGVGAGHGHGHGHGGAGGGAGTECEEWAKLMPVVFEGGSGSGSDGLGKDEDKNKEEMNVDGDGEDDAESKSKEKESAFERLAKYGVVDEMPFYTNTTYYALLRLLQVSIPISILSASRKKTN